MEFKSKNEMKSKKISIENESNFIMFSYSILFQIKKNHQRLKQFIQNTFVLNNSNMKLIDLVVIYYLSNLIIFDLNQI